MKKYSYTSMAKKIAITLFVFLTILIAPSTYCQTTQTKELNTIVMNSFTHFPKIKEAENSIAIASEKIKMVELNKQPDITGDASYAYIKPKIELPINGDKFQFAPVNNFSAGLNGTYTLLDFGRIKASITQAKNELTFSQHNKENIQHQIAYQLAAVYYYMVYLKKAINIQDSLLHTLSESKSITESQFKNGTALEIELLSIISNIDAEENKKIELTSMLHKQEILMEYASGISTTQGNEFDINIMSPITSINVELSPEVIMLQDKLQQAKQDVAINQLRNKPTVGLRASMGTRNGYIPNIGEMRFNYLGGINFSIPIYNGGKIKQQIKIQEKLADQQSLAIESMQSLIQKDIKQTLADLSSAQDRLKRSDSQIELAKAAALMAQNKLRHGTGTHLEVTAANSTLQKALLNQLQMQYQICSSKLEYGRLTGIKFW